MDERTKEDRPAPAGNPALVLRLLLPLAVIGVLALAPDAPAGGISDEQCPNIAGENTNTCPAGTVGVPYTIRFTESEGSGCGPGRQTFHLDSGALPPGLVLAPDGTVGGTSFQPGTFKFYVEMREPTDDPAHCAGKRTQKQFTLTIRRPPWIVSVPADTPASEVGVPFRIAVRARGGSGVFSWSLTSGALPDGLRLFADGTIEGRPRSSGTSRFTVRAEDTERRRVAWKVELVVAPRIRVRHRELPRAVTARRYRADLQAVGGVGPITWSVAAGRLPRGLRLVSATGRVIGTPREAGTHDFTVEARDGMRAADRRPFRMVVASADRHQR